MIRREAYKAPQPLLERAFFQSPGYSPHSKAAVTPKTTEKRRFPWIMGGTLAAAGLVALWLIQGGDGAPDSMDDLVRPDFPDSQNADSARSERFPVAGGQDINHDVLTSVDIEPRLLYDKETYLIIFNSYNYSQGNSELQKLLFEIMKTQHPEWHLPHTFDPVAFSKNHEDEFKRFVLSNHHSPFITEGSVVKSLRLETEKFYTTMLGGYDMSHANTQAVHELIKSDALYMEDGRERTENGHAKIKHFSYLVDYILKGEKVPGHSAYQGVFNSMKECLKEFLAINPVAYSPQEQSSFTGLQKIFSGYREHIHPEITVTDPELKSLLIQRGLIKP